MAYRMPKGLGDKSVPGNQRPAPASGTVLWGTRVTWRKLAALAEVGQALESARAALPPLPGRDALAAIAADLPALWHAPTTTPRDRKRLLRTRFATRS
jgi:hypothetical protein